MTTDAYSNALLDCRTGKAFTMVFAGLALTMTSFPNAILLPAFVAGFTRVLILKRPGSVNFPIDFTCSAAMPARFSTTCLHTLLFIPISAEIACTKPVFVIALGPAFIGFFIGSTILLKRWD